MSGKVTVRDCIRALLTDGQWHSVAEIFKAAWTALPPEQAIKRWHRRCDRGLKDMEARIAAGRRNFILGAIYDMRCDEHLECEGTGDSLRCRPGPRWGKPGRRVAQQSEEKRAERRLKQRSRRTRLRARTFREVREVPQ